MSIDSTVGKPWKVEPAFNVQHSIQSSQAYMTLGQHFESSSEWDKAIDAYRKAIAVDAGNTEAFNALGVALAQSGRLADAEITLRQAVALAPQRSHIVNNLGYVQLLAGKAEDAAMTLRAAVAMDGGNARAAANLQTAMARSGGSSDRMTAAHGSAEPSPIVSRAHAPDPQIGAALPSAVPTPRQVDAAVFVGERSSFKVGFAPDEATSAPVLVAATATVVRDAAAVPAAAVAPDTMPTLVRVEVSNGNGVPGMAARVGKWLANRGITTERLSNQPRFAQQHTVVQYRDGHGGSAQRIAHLMPAQAQADAQPTQGLRSDVRVVLGRDWVSAAACLKRNDCQPPGDTVLAAVKR